MLVGGFIDMSIPPPSVLSNYIDNDDDYISDPDKIRDDLPQPFRLINKLIDFTFDIAWDEIQKREEQRIADGLRIRAPKFECQSLQSKIGGTRAMVSSCDGMYVFIATETGVAVVKAERGEIVDQFVDEDVIITSISTSLLDDGLHIISTIDVQGVARLFLFNGDSVYLSKILTETEGTVANKVQISDETDYIAVSLVNQTSGEAWIDFHKVPKDVWIKEAGSLTKQTQQKTDDPVFSTETLESGNTTPEASESKETQVTTPVPDDSTNTQENKSQSNFRFSNTNIILKVKAPSPMKPSTATSTFNAFKVVDSNSDVIATGQNHLITQSHFDGRETAFKWKHKELQACATEVEETDVYLPNVHFISATRISPAGFDSGKPTSAMIWWKDRNQVTIYSLIKQAKDINYKPEQVWPMPHKITSSAVTSCTQLLALGLSNGTVIVWDLFSSLQRRIHSVSPESAIVQVAFMNPAATPQEQPIESNLPYQTQTSSYVLALSENGQLSYCDTTMGIEITKPVKVVHDELNARMTKFALLPGIPFMVLATFSDGNIFIVHALNGSFVCEIVVPQTHQLDEDCLGTVCAKGKTIFCNALVPEPTEPLETEEPNDTDSEYIPEEIAAEPKTTLFILRCMKFPVLESSFCKDLPKVPYVLHTTLDKRLDALMQQRVREQPIRQARLQAAWQNMGSTLELIIKSKTEERPKTAGSKYAASTLAGSEQDLFDSRYFGI